MTKLRLPRATELAHAWIRERLESICESGRVTIAIDATAGNGHDTEFLARLVGPGGRVIAFDIQAEAIHATGRRLEASGLHERVSLHLESHERICDVATSHVVMFNLGYCPGGDKTRITQPQSTVRALQAAAVGLAPGGLITVVCYPAHPGGREEGEAVLDWTRNLDPRKFRAMRCEMLLVQGEPAPFLVGIERVPAAS